MHQAAVVGGENSPASLLRIMAGSSLHSTSNGVWAINLAHVIVEFLPSEMAAQIIARRKLFLICRTQTQV
jgi:hypothetical protein